ncbi:hypothetical protein K2X85_16895 [bacterium]|nr:hypothetical protein [bacterium]
MNKADLCFSWHHSEEGWLETADKLEHLATSDNGHIWLDAIGIEDAFVLASINEYGIKWWENQGPL